MIAIGKSIELRVPVTLAPGRTCGVLKRKTVVLQHVATYEELLGIFGTVEHGVERYSSTRSLLNEGITELHVVGACRERHIAYGKGHGSSNYFMM
jgi:hypothetical protein